MNCGRFPTTEKTSIAATVIDTLFGDLPVYAWPPGDADELPWSAFVEARQNPERAIELWRTIAASDVPPRHVLQAWHFLREHGEQPAAEEAVRVLGLVVEMGLENGVDVLAVYSDRSVRYYNYAGDGIVLEPVPPTLEELVDALLAAAVEVVARTGPWSGPRPGSPRKDETRLTFLTPGGRHVGEGPTKKLYDDPIGGPVLKGATLLLTEITART